MRSILLLSSLAFLAGCVSAPEGYWYRVSDNTRVDANPTILSAFNKDRAVCDGEAAQAALTSTAPSRVEHNRLVNLVFDGCLTKRGYIRKAG